jgi:hypothetical protein
MAQTQYLVALLLSALWRLLSDSGFLQRPQWSLLKRSAMLIGAAAGCAPRPTSWNGWNAPRWKILYATILPSTGTGCQLPAAGACSETAAACPAAQ